MTKPQNRETYVGKLIPDPAESSEPLRRLLKRKASSKFKDLKLHFARISNLSYFDPNNRTRQNADASPVALGAVLVLFETSGEPKIVASPE